MFIIVPFILAVSVYVKRALNLILQFIIVLKLKGGKLQVASPGFPDLEELSLAGIEDDNTTSKFIDDNGVERILKTSHKLRLLDVRGCTKITDSGLVKVPAWDLEHLFLSGEF